MTILCCFLVTYWRGSYLIKDNFQAFLIEGADLTENYEFPILQPCYEIPKDLVAFSKNKETENLNSFVHFYERDKDILPFARNPRNYFSRLSQFKGVIGCDISMYRNMPLAMQIAHTYYNRALSFWLQNHGLSVIPNVRYGDARSYSFCFEGIPQNSVISIGTYGCIKEKDDIDNHIRGVAETIKQLGPKAIIFYGTINKEVEYMLTLEKIDFVVFRSYTSDVFNSSLDKSCPLFEEIGA